MRNLKIIRGIDPIRHWGPRDRLRMRETVGVPPIRDRRIFDSIAWGIDLELVLFVVVVVVHIERDLVQVLLQIRNRVPHHSNFPRPQTTQTLFLCTGVAAKRRRIREWPDKYACDRRFNWRMFWGFDLWVGNFGRSENDIYIYMWGGHVIWLTNQILKTLRFWLMNLTYVWCVTSYLQIYDPILRVGVNLYGVGLINHKTSGPVCPFTPTVRSLTCHMSL